MCWIISKSLRIRSYHLLETQKARKTPVSKQTAEGWVPTQESGSKQDSRAPVVARGLWLAADVTVQGGLTTANEPVVIIAGYGDLGAVCRRQGGLAQ